jgi:predicted O-methyltransferase YrrM/DNA-binding PadR family transcriptional regulator
MHGYEMLQELERRTQGLWRPSPGSLYPALQLLEDQGLVRSVSDDGRRRYELTEAGQAERAARASGPAPWEVMVGAADQADMALNDMLRHVGVAISQVAEAGTDEQKTTAEALLAELRRQTYLLLAGQSPAGTAPAGREPTGDQGKDTWRRVDEYFEAALIGRDDALEAAQQASAAAGLPAISVSASQGKLLALLARSIGARRILEIGTLGGYSAIWLGRALAPGGRLISLEIEPRHAEVARRNVARAGIADQVDIRVAPALDSLEALAAAGEPPFDLVFIDADKQSNADYLAWAVRLTHPGSIIVVDNVARGGRVADAASTDSAVQGVRRLVDAMAAEPRLDATTVQTVGSKGYDGFALAIVVDPDAT